MCLMECHVSAGPDIEQDDKRPSRGGGGGGGGRMSLTAFYISES